MNPALRDKILFQSAEYINAKQNELLRRFIFKENREGEDDNPLPYSLITKDLSSNFFKRKINKEIRIAILDSESMGISLSSIIHTLKNNRISQVANNLPVSGHYPLDEKISVIDFYKQTGKFVNVYQLLDDGSLKKIDPLKTYMYNGNKVGLHIEILGTNSICIEFYDNNETSNYMVEIMSCVKDYEQVPFNKYKPKDNQMVFMDGILIDPNDSYNNKSYIEVYTLSSMIYNKTIDMTYDEEKDIYKVSFDNDYFISNKLIIPYAYNTNDGWKYVQYTDSFIEHHSFIPNEFNVENYVSDKLKVIVLGNKDVANKSLNRHISLYDILSEIYPDKKFLELILDETLGNENDDNKLLLRYPYFYREELENDMNDDFYLETINRVRSSQIATRDNKKYLKFIFPIKSFSFMIFLNGKLINPDIYEVNNGMDMEIYIDMEKLSVQNEDGEFIILGNPITIVRCKSFYSENNRYVLVDNPIYLPKTEYPTYEYNSDHMYVKKTDGRYIYYNNRYYMISNEEYDFDNGIFNKSENDGSYYKIITNRMIVPFNKYLENNIHNLTFVKELSDSRGKIIEDVIFDRVQANSKYPNIPPFEADKKFNEVINAHCNSSFTFDLGYSDTESYGIELDGSDVESENDGSGITIDPGNAANDYEILIHRALSNANVTMSYNNIAVIRNKIYFFNDNEKISLSSEGLFIKNGYVYNILSETFTNIPSIGINIIYTDIEYLHKNIYSNNIITFHRKGYPRLYTENKEVILYNTDIGYSKYHSSTGSVNEIEIPEPLRYSYDQIMTFANGLLTDESVLSNNQSVYLLNHSSYEINDIFITSIPKLVLYQTIEDLTLYSNTVIELSNNFSDEIRQHCKYHKNYRKNIDITHVPLSLKYMMIFVNGLYMDKNHVEILSNRRFMLKNLNDFSNFLIPGEYDDVYPSKETDPEGYNAYKEDVNRKQIFKINSIEIYLTPFVLDHIYDDYYSKFTLKYEDEYNNHKYYEYSLNDILFDKYLSELVSTRFRISDDIVFEGDNIKEDYFYVPDFRHISLTNFKEYELHRFKHDKIDAKKMLSSYTHDELSKYTNNDLRYMIYGKE